MGEWRKKKKRGSSSTIYIWSGCYMGLLSNIQKCCYFALTIIPSFNKIYIFFFVLNMFRYSTDVVFKKKKDKFNSLTPIHNKTDIFWIDIFRFWSFWYQHRFRYIFYIFIHDIFWNKSFVSQFLLITIGVFIKKPTMSRKVFVLCFNSRELISLSFLFERLEGP